VIFLGQHIISPHVYSPRYTLGFLENDTVQFAQALVCNVPFFFDTLLIILVEIGNGYSV
jgi:hypothetical protein